MVLIPWPDGSAYCIDEREAVYAERDNIRNMLAELLERGSSEEGVFAAYIDFAVCVAEHAELDIPTVLSHGDFQSGNIWITEKGDTIIYDWETNGRRSVWYDPATLLWKLHSGAFAIDIRSMVMKDQRFTVNDPKKDYSENQLKAVARIIELENLAFYLSDILQLPEQFRGQCFQQLSRNLFNRTGIRSSDGA
jgi:aminoglycoside phosphotransferase (APT) family kinase protein